jgi:hypothetical protein
MWNEAFATYSESLLSRLGDRASAPAAGAGAWHAASQLPSWPPLSRARDALHPAHSAVGYQKGALVLAQLERLLGSEVILRCLRAFVSRHKRGEAADWDDFEQAVRGIAGAEWHGFFTAWLNRTEIPRFALRDVRLAAVARGYEVTGAVVPSLSGFWSLAPLVLRTEGVSVGASVVVRGEAAPFRFASQDRPSSIALDPDGLMLRSGDLAVRTDLAGRR